MLAPEAEAALERLLEPFKLDLLYCPDRFWTWEQAAINYYEFADLLLVRRKETALLRGSAKACI